GQEGTSYCLASLLAEGGERLGSRDFATERPQLVLQHALLEHLDEVPDDAARDLMIQLADAAHRSTSDQIVGHDITQVLDRIGPRWMSWSDELEAGYGIDMPRHRFDEWIALMGEMLRAPVFRGAPMAMAQCVNALVWEFHTARARDLVVRELWRMRGRSFDGQRIVAGAREMRLAGAKQFHSTWYVPNNIAIVLVGDLDPAEALPVLERELGSWAPKALPASDHAGIGDAAQAPVRHRIEDAGGPLLHAAWARPSDAPVELDALAATLAGPDGLLALLTGDVAEFSLERRLQTLWIVARPRPDRSLEETEAAFTAAIAAIADDRVPEHVWPTALASGELARLDWAISTGALADRIALAYVEREPWPQVAARLATAPTRADVVTAAKWLRAREPVIVHQAPGEPWSVTMRPLPFVVTQTATGRRSELANALLEDDRTPVEPRFLVAGSHFAERSVGGGRIVTATDDGPLFRLSWIVPRGADDDAWVCDAVRAKVSAARLPGLQITPVCSTSQTRITVVGAAHAWPAVWPALAKWLASDELAPDVVREHVATVLRDRATLRDNSASRIVSQYTWFLRGEHALDAELPDDDALRTKGAREIPRALRELVAMPPDLAYAGPQPDALHLPPTSSPAPRRVAAPLQMRAVPRPTVVLFDEPHRETVEVWVAATSPARDTDEQLVALAYNYLHSDEGQSGTIESTFMPHSYAPEPSYVPVIHSFV
ncbi:MAG TPA: insulinase family protein, partial [Nannocystaceae bacterium]|nr:insulinase family protein [Nannocystaceae bacterium]